MLKSKYKNEQHLTERGGASDSATSEQSGPASEKAGQENLNEPTELLAGRNGIMSRFCPGVPGYERATQSLQ